MTRDTRRPVAAAAEGPAARRGPGPFSFLHIGAELGTARGAQYAVRRIDAKLRIIFIVDHDERLSVTNDAEAVVEQLMGFLAPDWRIVYRDTNAEWDELGHDGQRFTMFKPCPDRAAAWGGL